MILIGILWTNIGSIKSAGGVIKTSLMMLFIGLAFLSLKSVLISGNTLFSLTGYWLTVRLINDDVYVRAQ